MKTGATMLWVHSMMMAVVAFASSSASSTTKLPTAYDLRVIDLDRAVDAFSSFPGRMYAGSLPMDHKSDTPGRNPYNERTGYLQFWLFVPDVIAAKNTMVAWFNGGPGCSSFSAGVMFEHSPVTVPLNPAGWCCEKQDEPLVYNRYAWTNATVMLYVEQPIGVGFSEATNDTPEPFSEDDVAADFDAFLQNFYKVFDGYELKDGTYDPKLDMTKHKLNLVGESYAGIYIPSVARGIYLNNMNNLENIDGSERFQVPLSGIAIGNGKIDGPHQDAATIDYAYWHGLIDQPTRDYLYAEWHHCIANMKLGKVGKNIEPAPFHSFSVRDDCGVFAGVLAAAGAGAFENLMGGPNIYEYSTWDAYEAADGENGTVSKFYNNHMVQEALNVPKHRRQPYHQWAGCIPETDPNDPGRRLGEATETSDFLAVIDSDSAKSTSMMNRRRLFMDYDTPHSVTPYIGQLLDEAGIDVLLYSGDRDIICCTQGTEESLRRMDWSGTREPAPSNLEVSMHRNAWTEAPRGLWLYEDYPAGYVKKHKKLSLVTVYNAGHMVPYNQPGPALDMLTRFLKGESFYDRPLVSFASYPMPEEVVADTTTTTGVDKSTLPDATTSSGANPSSSKGATGIGIVVSVAVGAFGLGVFVARATLSRSASQALSSEEVEILKKDENYNSI